MDSAMRNLCRRRRAMLRFCTVVLLSLTFAATAAQGQQPSEDNSVIVITFDDADLLRDDGTTEKVITGRVFEVLGREKGYILVPGGKLKTAAVAPLDQAAARLTDAIAKDASAQNYYVRSQAYYRTGKVYE